MTNDDRYREIGRVVSEHQQAERDLTLLRSRAVKIGELLAAAGAALMTANQVGTFQHGPPCDVDGSTVRTRRNNEAISGPWPTADELSALLAEMRALTATAAALAAERKTLGV